jgi:hypothetical protein
MDIKDIKCGQRWISVGNPGDAIVVVEIVSINCYQCHVIVLEIKGEGFCPNEISLNRTTSFYPERFIGGKSLFSYPDFRFEYLPGQDKTK